MYTENNHKSMKTQVETFIIEETESLIYDNEQLDKWNNHINELGLTGQTRIVKKEKSPIPFLYLNKSLKNICKQLCKREVDISEYDRTPIPVEILDLIALSKRENYFSKIQIWYNDENPDPFCIGLNYSTYYSQNNDGSLQKSFKSKIEARSHMTENGWTREPYGTDIIYYLIGKWADVKQSWEELKARAIESFKQDKEHECNQKIRDAKRELEDLKNKAYEQFN